MGKGEHEDHHVGHSEDATIHPVMATEVRSTTLLAKSQCFSVCFTVTF